MLGFPLRICGKGSQCTDPIIELERADCQLDSQPYSHTRCLIDLLAHLRAVDVVAGALPRGGIGGVCQQTAGEEDPLLQLLHRAVGHPEEGVRGSARACEEGEVMGEGGRGGAV